MNFIEKDLEDIIYHNYSKCLERGLYLGDPAKPFKLYRQVQLGGYGVADLILIQINKVGNDRRLFINIIECKLNQIDINAYVQAKRYETAIKKILEKFNLKNTYVKIRTCLIGQKLDLNSDFVYVLNSDLNCFSFLYSYSVDGINFSYQGREWSLSKADLQPTIAKHKTSFLNYAKDILSSSECEELVF